MNATPPRAPSAAPGPVVLYRYGLLAWFWRVLMVFGVAIGAVFAVLAVRGGGPWPWLGAAAVLVPVLFFGAVVATRVERDGDVLRVATLSGCRRTVPLARLGGSTVRQFAESTLGRVHAPRLWQRVRGSLPVYLDLFATIPDPDAFAAVFGSRPA